MTPAVCLLRPLKRLNDVRVKQPLAAMLILKEIRAAALQISPLKTGFKGQKFLILPHQREYDRRTAENGV